MDLFGVTIPLWAILIGAVLVIFVVWKLIKFAIKILIVLVVFFTLLIGLDLLGVFNFIQENILTIFM
jgi:hypothetical protein